MIALTKYTQVLEPPILHQDMTSLFIFLKFQTQKRNIFSIRFLVPREKDNSCFWQTLVARKHC